MSAALRRPTMSEAAFLDWAQTQDVRYEFDGTGPAAMVGGTEAHGTIQANLLRMLGNALRGTGCRALGSDNFVRASGRLRLPDVLVICRDVQRRSRVTTDPVAVFEILSDSTADLDQTVKAQEYWQTPCIRHYVLLEQGRIAGAVLTRGPNDWDRHPVAAGETMELPSLGLALPLADTYEGLDTAAPG